MNDAEKNELIETSWKLHHCVESYYLDHSATKGENNWLDKQRLLLADMAIHLFQTSVNPGDMDLEKLRNNLHAILTIADPFIPQAELKKVTENLYDEHT